MIDTIIRNLMSNSIKFSNEQGTIHVQSKNLDSEIELRITDEGVGMDPNWFNKFPDVEEIHTNPGTKGEQGIGFGLIICRDFIQMNGGSLVCESELGSGTTFILTLERA